VQRHGISRHLQPTASGSTPHDRVTVLQVCSSCPPASNRPRQSAPRYPPIGANRPTIYRVQRHPPLIRQPLHGRTTRCAGSIQITHLTRGAQIPIAPAARPDVPLSALSSLGGFRTPAAEYAAPSLKRPASETLHKTGKSQIENNNTASPSKADVSIAAASQITQTSPRPPR
jgi:hypothetical protein